jgi:hypothetical protein
LLVSLLVGLHIIEGLQHGLHKLILGGDQLFEVDIVVGDVVVVADWPLHWLFLVHSILGISFFTSWALN